MGASQLKSIYGSSALHIQKSLYELIDVHGDVKWENFWFILIYESWLLCSVFWLLQMVILSLIVKKSRVKALVKDKRVALEAFGSYVDVGEVDLQNH